MDVIFPFLLLADDDKDDRLFFKEVVEELPFLSTLLTVNNGHQLMELLHQTTGNLPHILFLDLNMPGKTGFECLVEIKGNSRLIHLPVVIYSTSLDPVVADELFKHGAHYYLRKPGEFSTLKLLIHKAVMLVLNAGNEKPPRHGFILKAD